MSAVVYPVIPTDRDRSASLTAVGMGEMTAALDLLAACTRDVHQLRSDGSCRCGLHKATKHVRRQV